MSNEKFTPEEKTDLLITPVRPGGRTDVLKKRL